MKDVVLYCEKAMQVTNRLGGNGICESIVYGRQAGNALTRISLVRSGP